MQQYDPVPQRPRIPMQPRTLRTPPRRPFTDDDARRLRDLLTYGDAWTEQYEIPPRPWSATSERQCEEVRVELEKLDWEAARAYERPSGSRSL